MSRAAIAIQRAFRQRPSGAVRAVSHAFPLATRTWRELTPDDALGALEAAQVGLIRPACDFVDALLTDDRIAGVLDTRVLGMLGLDLYFEGEELPEWWSLAKEAELARLMIWGLMLGVSFAHIEANGSLKWWHPRNFDHNRITGEWFVTTTEGRELVSRHTGEWVIFEPFGSSDAALAGLWVSLSLPVMVKLYSLHDRARASEVFGSAMVVGKAPEGSTEPQRQKWLADIKKLARSTRVVLPDGYDLDLLEAQGQTWGIYQQSIQWADDAITIRIAGQLPTTTGAGASFSRGDVHEKIASSLLKYGEAVFSTCLANDYIPFVWGCNSVARWQTASPDDLIGVGAAIKAFADGVAAITPLLAGETVEIDIRAYMQKFGILTRPKPQAAPNALDSEPANDVYAKFLTAASASVRRETATDRREAYASAAIPTKPPTEFRVFKMGANISDYGKRYFTAESARLVMAANGNRDVMIDLEHNSLDKESKAYDPNARGWCRLQVRRDGLWAVNVRWNRDGMRRIIERLQRGISPVFWSRKKDGVITSLHNLALTAMPATHDGVILIAASKGSNMGMLLKLLGLPDDASTEDVLKALGIDASASPDDVLGAIEKALEAAAGGGSGDSGGEGGGETATENDADPPPAGASDDGDKKKTDASKKRIAQTTTGKGAVTSLSVDARISALEKGDEQRERNSLIASRDFKPWEKKMLLGATMATVREYVANAPKPAPKREGAEAGAEGVVIASAALDAVAKATGLNRNSVAEYAKKGA